MLSKQHYRDLETGKIVTKSERINPNTTKIPIFLWGSDTPEKLAVGFEMGTNGLVNTYSYNTQTNIVELYGIRLVYTDEFSSILTFYDIRKKERHNIEIKGNPYWVIRQTGRKDRLIIGIDITMNFDGFEKTFRLDVDGNRGNFKPIGYLGQRFPETTTKAMSTCLNFGMLDRNLSVVYKDKTLDGSCYVLMLGFCAILLRDNLSFDAMVILKGYDKEKIIIDRFIYTSNIYLIKVATFW
jgi:hypothetical protein